MRGCRYGKGLIYYYYYEYYYYDYYHLFPFKGCIQRIQNPLSLSFLFESLATHASVKITVLIYILSIFFFFQFYISISMDCFMPCQDIYIVQFLG